LTTETPRLAQQIAIVVPIVKRKKEKNFQNLLTNENNLLIFALKVLATNVACMFNNLLGVVMFTINSTCMVWDVRCLRRQAQKAVELGTNLGIGSKTDTEIRRETDELVMKALVPAIQRYDSGFEKRPFDTPESLYERLWEECYDYERAQSDMMDIEEETKERLNKEIEKVMDYLDDEYNRRSNELDEVEFDEEV
jgi:hypothetical protein